MAQNFLKVVYTPDAGWRASRIKYLYNVLSPSPRIFPMHASTVGDQLQHVESNPLSPRLTSPTQPSLDIKITKPSQPAIREKHRRYGSQTLHPREQTSPAS